MIGAPETIRGMPAMGVGRYAWSRGTSALRG